MNKEPKPALLTRSECSYLLGKELSKHMIKKVRHEILSKLRVFINLELPLLRKASESWPNLLMILSPLVTSYGNLVTPNGNPSEKDMIAQEVLTTNEIKPRAGLDPATYCLQGNRFWIDSSS